MWAHYADAGFGLALIYSDFYSYIRLGPYQPINVVYQDEHPKMSRLQFCATRLMSQVCAEWEFTILSSRNGAENFQAALEGAICTKLRGWSYEEEVRLLRFVGRAGYTATNLELSGVAFGYNCPTFVRDEIIGSFGGQLRFFDAIPEESGSVSLAPA